MQANYKVELEQFQAKSIELAYQTIREGKWEKEIEQDGVVFYSKPGSTGWKITRSELIPKIDPKKAVDVLIHQTRFQLYNHTAQEINLIKKIDDNISIQYILTKPNQVLPYYLMVHIILLVNQYFRYNQQNLLKYLKYPQKKNMLEQRQLQVSLDLNLLGMDKLTMVQSFDSKGDAQKDLFNSIANKVVNYNKIFVENLKKATKKE